MASNDSSASNKPTYRFKHLACNTCRKRKLRCNGTRPVCSSCEKSGRECDWEDTLRKTGPRRGYVRSLEARLADVEALLGRPGGSASGTNYSPPEEEEEGGEGIFSHDALPDGEEWPNSGSSNDPAFPPGLDQSDSISPQLPSTARADKRTGLRAPQSDHSSQSAYAPSLANNASWELSAVGLQEPLPSPQAIDELHQIFFEKIYPRVPILHKGRYLAAMSLPATSRLRPPVCLSYSLWCLGASLSDNYSAVTEHFYHRARKYMEIDEIQGRGQHVVTLAHAQATAYLAYYEMAKMYFPRAWLNVGRAVRLCHMMNLHRLDGAGLEVREMLSAPTNWLELEERRRTFWAVFVQDRYQSISSGWPMIIDERDITTHLPSSEPEFLAGHTTRPSLSLADCMTPAGAKHLSLFAASATIAALFGRTLTHLHRKDLYDGGELDDGDVFWRRHRYLDNVLLNTLQYLPDHLQISSGIHDPQTVLLHINVQASTICLHQAAVFKAQSSSSLSDSKLVEGKARCLHAAENMMTILRLLNPMVMQNIGPWLPYCLYLSARVLVQALAEPDHPDNQGHLESLNLLLGILRSMKSRSPYTTSLLMQLEKDSAMFGKLNPIGHIVVPVDDITENLEQDQASQAFKMDPSATFQSEPTPTHSDPTPLQGLGGPAGVFARPQTISRTHSDPYSRS